MKRLLVIIMLAVGLAASAQVNSVGSFWRVEDPSMKFGKDLPPGFLVRIKGDGWYTVEDSVRRTVVVQTAIDSGWIVKDPGLYIESDPVSFHKADSNTAGNAVTLDYFNDNLPDGTPVDSIPFIRSAPRSTIYPRTVTDKVHIGAATTPDSTLKVTGGVNVTRGLITGNDIKVNGVTVGRGKLSSEYNAAFGYQALNSNTNGINNIAIGYYSLRSSTTGTENTSVGASSLRSNTSGIENTSVGSSSLRSNTNGTGNTSVGNRSLYSNIDGIRNTVFGYRALEKNTSGHSNIALGDSAGFSYTTLSKRMYLGARDSTTTGIFFNRTTGINKGYWNGKLNIKTVPYSAAATLKVLAQDTTTGDVYRTTVTGGGGTTYTATSPMSVAGDDVHILADTLTAWRTKQNQGATAYGWGNHSTQNYVVNPMVDNGDMIYGGVSGVPTKLKQDGDGKVLSIASGIPKWVAPYDTTLIPWKYSGGNTIQRGSGNVGIGTTNPTALLFIENASQGAIIRNNSTVSIPAGSGTYNLSQLDLLHNGTTGVFARQVLRYNRTTSRYEFMQSFRNAAGGSLNVQYLDIDNGSYQIQSGITNMDFKNSGNVTFSNSGSVGIATTSPSTYLDINGNKFRLRTAKTPSSSTDTGNAGDICWDTSYIYICTATNTWKRVAISTW